MKRKFGHWTPHYIVNRTRVWQYEKQHPDAPWLTRHAVNFLSQWLKPTDVGFEWGSGRSTLWFCKRVQRLTSIEHNSAWFEIVQEQLHERQTENVQHKLLGMQNGADSPYVRSIDEVENASLDFVLVNGRLRAYCVLAALEKLRPGGLLVVNNIDLYYARDASSAAIKYREGETEAAWKSVKECIGKWRMYWTSNGIFDTALFWRPIYRA